MQSKYQIKFAASIEGITKKIVRIKDTQKNMLQSLVTISFFFKNQYSILNRLSVSLPRNISDMQRGASDGLGWKGGSGGGRGC